MASVYEHLLYRDVWVSEPCMVVALYRDGVHIRDYGFHVAEREELSDGVLCRVMAHSGATFVDTVAMERYTARISREGNLKDLEGRFSTTSLTFEFYYENH